jgi:hypothetical protein
MDILYIDKFGMKFRNKMKFQYGVRHILSHFETLFYIKLSLLTCI